MNAVRPAYQFLDTSFHMIGFVPVRMTLNIFLKVIYEAPEEPITSRTKVIFSKLDSKYYDLFNASMSRGTISRTSPTTA